MRDNSRSPWDAPSPKQDQRDGGEPQPVAPVLAPKRKPRKAYYAAAAALVLAIAAGTFLLHHAPPGHLPDSREWEQLTFFTDSAVYPTLSSDGRMLAFIRGDDSFVGVGEIYVKLLPGGEPVQLTHDSRLKAAPSFSPDNSRIGYSVVGIQSPVIGEVNLSGHPSALRTSLFGSNTRVETTRYPPKETTSSPAFSSDGRNLYFLKANGQTRGEDGTGRRKVPSRRILEVDSVSPDGRWVVAGALGSDKEHTRGIKAFALDGSATVTLCVNSVPVGMR
jgi:Tol biopolymer transport system component